MMSKSIRRSAPTFVLALLLNVPLFVSSGLAQEVVEQVLEGEVVDADSLEVETSAELLRLRPRFRGNFDSESGGIDSSISADAFLPFLQQPGASTFYFTPKLRFDFDNDSTVGGNLIVGYRSYSQERDRILGGYLSFDVRDTGESVFPQVGFGFERLGRFDIRANAYVPVGDTSQVVDRFESGFSITDTAFRGRSLQVTAQNTIWEDSEVALGGFDIEAGGSIFRWHSYGNLELFGGAYYLGGDNVSAVGGRGRVALTPTDGIQLGVGVQGDEVFGTRVFFNATASLPHPKAIAPTSEEEEALAAAGDTFARLDDQLARIDSVVVDTQRDSQTQVVAGPALNPVTGEPWVFTHVTAGGNSDGSFEDPFATVQEGLDATTGDGNDIVYVRLGNDTIPAFTIPDNVQVMSAGPEQSIDLQVAGIDTAVFEGEPLPESGTGELPLVVGTVTMGNSTLLSGFDIQPQLDVEIDPQPAAGDPGVLARSVSDFTITDNEISTIDANGIELDGDITNGEILNNAIAVTTTIAEDVGDEVVSGEGGEGEAVEGDNDSSVAGIFMSQTDANLRGVTISENDIAVSGTSGSGIIADVIGDESSASITDLTISSNAISVTTEETDAVLQEGNPFFLVTSPTSAGIEIDVEHAELSTVTIADNEIAFSGLSGSGIATRLIAGGDTASIDGLEIANNTIDVALAQELEGDYGGSGSGISTNASAYNGGTANLSNLTITGNTTTGEADSQFTGVETNLFAGRFNRFSGDLEEATETAGGVNTIATSDMTIANNTISSVSGDRSTGVATNIYAANNGIYFGDIEAVLGKQSASVHLDRTTISGNTIATEAGDRAAGISTNIIALSFSRYGLPEEEALAATGDIATSGASVSLTSTDISGNAITSEAEDVAVGIEANAIAVNFDAGGLLERDILFETSERSQSIVTLVDTTITGNTIASQASEEATGIGLSTGALNFSYDGRLIRVEEEELATSSSLANVTLQNTAIDGNEIENEATNARGIVLDSSATDFNPFFRGQPRRIEEPELELRELDIAEVAVAEITTDANASVVIGNTTIANNTITNVGDNGVGIEITGDGTPFFYGDEFDGPSRGFGAGNNQVAIDRTTISGNTIAHTTDSSSTAGILVSVGGEAGGDFILQETEISGNIISGNSSEADGIIVEAFGEFYSDLEIANTLISDNTVTLEGAAVDGGPGRIESSGIAVSFTTSYYSYLSATNTTIADNSVITTDDDSIGIELFVDAGQYYGFSEIDVSSTTISGNEVATAGDRADGIAIEANAYSYDGFADVTLDSTTISGNTVVTRGDDAAGIIASSYAYGGSSQIDVTISNNTIDTFGSDSPGILVEAYDDFGRGTNDVTIIGNIVTTRRDDSDGIVLEGRGDSDTETTLSRNIVTTRRNDAAGIEVRSEFGGDIDATISDNDVLVQDGSTSFLIESNFFSSVCADLTGNTSRSSGMSFDLGIFENAPGSSVDVVGFTDFPALSANNNNTFVDIDGDTPGSVISCSAEEL